MTPRVTPETGQESDAPRQTFHVPAHPGSSGTVVSRRMSVLPRKDNPRERAVRSALHARGLRFRVTYKVPGLARRSIDVAFTRARVAVFLDGCFWHGCPDHGTAPRSNGGWWAQKIQTNQLRDADTTRYLTEGGWLVVRIWEHVPVTDAAELIADAVVRRRRPRPPRATGSGH